MNLGKGLNTLQLFSTCTFVRYQPRFRHIPLRVHGNFILTEYDKFYLNPKWCMDWRKSEHFMFKSVLLHVWPFRIF